MSEILLETKDGYQFQKLVVNIFKRQSFLNVKVGPKGADMGIDVTMKQNAGMNFTVGFAVQCKHHPKGVVSRPVVQKLHSAIIVSPNVDKGIIVTSGHFSEAAVKYAEKVGIELIDGDKLIELGKQVGIPLLYKKRLPIAENCFPISDKSQVIKKLVEFLKSDLKGFSQQLFKVDRIGLAYTRTVSYYGRNNVLYTKTCVPKKKHITLENMKRVYFAPWDIMFSLKDRKYVVGVLESSERFQTLPSSFIVFEKEAPLNVYPEKCMVCSKELKHEKFLCNDCGKIACGNDSFECKVCGKIICREDTIFKRKFLILKEKYCSDCARSLE